MKNRGFTLIEVLVSVAILIVIIASSYACFAMIYTAIAHSHFRMIAADLANEQFEIFKNMPYSAVGTLGGTPNGIIPTSQILVRGGVSYTVTTVVQNVNDPFDGNPDSFPADYKLVEININCQGCKNFVPVIVTGRVAPANLESS